MELMRWSPFQELTEMQSRLSSLLDGQLGLRGENLMMPAIDVYEENGKMMVEALMPAFREEDVEVSLSKDGLEIRAERQEDKEQKQRNYLLREITSGSFYRRIKLAAEADTEAAKASFKDGKLSVEIPLRESQSSKRLLLGGKNKVK
jgi:HSP20 family protein